MKSEAANSNSFQDLLERLEQDKSLNLQITAAVTVLWFLLASIVAAIGGSGGNIGIVFLTALYHFAWGYFVINHIFNYALPKVTRLEIFTKWLRDYWRWFLTSLLVVLFLYPSFWFGTIVSFILQQFQIQNDFAPFQRFTEILRIINFSWCKGFRAVKF